LTEESTSGAQQMVQDKAQQAKEQVKQATGSAQDRIREQVDTRSTEAGHQIDSVGQAMRTASEQLKGQGNELPAKVAEQLAQRAEQAGSYLRESALGRGRHGPGAWSGRRTLPEGVRSASLPAEPISGRRPERWRRQRPDYELRHA
jgi:hypothetical protein